MEGILVFSDRAPVINSMLRTSGMWVQNATPLGPTILAHGGFGGSGAGSGVCSADGKHKRRANTVVE